MAPTLTYEAVIAALEGRAAVAAWLELAELLEGRAGWSFALTDSMPLWCRQGGRLWATTESRRRRPGGRRVVRYCLWRRGRCPDEVDCWEFPTALELVDELSRLERRRRPSRPPTWAVPSHATAVPATP